MKEVDGRHAYSLVTAWSFLRRRRADPNRDPNAETTVEYRADTVDVQLSRKYEKGRKALNINAFRLSSYLHTQEVTGSSSAVSTQKGLSH